MVALALSWSFQNAGPVITLSSSSRRACLSPKSKRVSELVDLLDDGPGGSFQLGVHGHGSFMGTNPFAFLGDIPSHFTDDITSMPIG